MLVSLTLFWSGCKAFQNLPNLIWKMNLRLYYWHFGNGSAEAERWASHPLENCRSGSAAPLSEGLDCNLRAVSSLSSSMQEALGQGWENYLKKMRWVLETDGVEPRSRGPGHTFWGQVDGCVVLKGAPIQTRAIVILARAHICSKEQVMLCAMTVKGRACSGSTRFAHSGDFFYTHFHTSPKPTGDTLRKVKCFWIKVLWSSVSPAARTQHQLSANLQEKKQERPAAFCPTEHLEGTPPYLLSPHLRIQH